jgi:hypothetical protein
LGILFQVTKHKRSFELIESWKTLFLMPQNTWHANCSVHITCHQGWGQKTGGIMNKEEIVSVLEALGLIATIATAEPTTSGEVSLSGGGLKH